MLDVKNISGKSIFQKSASWSPMWDASSCSPNREFSSAGSKWNSNSAPSGSRRCWPTSRPGSRATMTCPTWTATRCKTFYVTLSFALPTGPLSKIYSIKPLMYGKCVGGGDRCRRAWTASSGCWRRSRSATGWCGRASTGCSWRGCSARWWTTCARWRRSWPGRARRPGRRPLRPRSTPSPTPRASSRAGRSCPSSSTWTLVSLTTALTCLATCAAR